MSIRRLPGHTVNIDPIYPRIPRNFENHTHAMNVHDHYACAEFARALEYIDMMIFTKYFTFGSLTRLVLVAAVLELAMKGESS